MSVLDPLPDVGDIVVVEQLQTGVVVSVDPDTDTFEWRHDENGEVYRSPWRLARHLRHGEPRLRRGGGWA